MKINRRDLMKRMIVAPIAIKMGLSQTVSAKQTKQKQKEYNIIDDLVEEMNRHDAENPGVEFRYFIHCNYSGLGMLNQAGRLEREEYKPDLERGYRYIIWILLQSEVLSSSDMLCTIAVGVSLKQKTDIELFAVPKEQCRNRYYVRNYCFITSRCFNVDYTEQGKVLMELA